MLKKGEVKYGDILWVQFDPSVGHEFQDKRPALVIQADRQIMKSNLVTVVPITSNKANKTSDDIVVEPDSDNGLRHTSVIKVYDIVSCDYQRLIGRIGVVSSELSEQVRQYLKRHFDI